MNKKTWWLAAALSGLAAFAIIAVNAASENSQAIPTLAVKVVGEYPHDPAAFSQGLVVEGDTLYEGTGKYGASKLRKIDLQSGAIQAEVPLGREYFGEGITSFGDRIYQLTWKERLCIVYDKPTLKPLGSLRYAGEGWGLANDGQRLFLSDGTSTIRVLDPQTLKVIKQFSVRAGQRRIKNLNELEFVDGQLYANIWYEDTIARIDPQSGQVTAWIDCSAVYPIAQRPDREHVLNGIAYDAKANRLFVTGKHWPKLYEIEVLDVR